MFERLNAFVKDNFLLSIGVGVVFLGVLFWSFGAFSEEYATQESVCEYSVTDLSLDMVDMNKTLVDFVLPENIDGFKQVLVDNGYIPSIDAASTWNTVAFFYDELIPQEVTVILIMDDCVVHTFVQSVDEVIMLMEQFYETVEA